MDADEMYFARAQALMEAHAGNVNRVVTALIEEAMTDDSLYEAMIPPDVIQGISQEFPEMPANELRAVALRTMQPALAETLWRAGGPASESGVHGRA